MLFNPLFHPKTPALHKLIACNITLAQLQPCGLLKQQKMVLVRARLVFRPRRKVRRQCCSRFRDIGLGRERGARDPAHDPVAPVSELGVCGRRRIGVDEHECEGLV